jgi:hypothetical protein
MSGAVGAGVLAPPEIPSTEFHYILNVITQIFYESSVIELLI